MSRQSFEPSSPQSSVPQSADAAPVPRSRTRTVTALIGLMALVSLVSGCIVVPVGPPRYYHPYYRYY